MDNFFKNIEIFDINTDISNIIDPVACTRKYLVAASSSLFLFVVRIKGMIDIRFTSMLSHSMIQLDDDIIIKVEIMRTVRKDIVLGDDVLIIIR